MTAAVELVAEHARFFDHLVELVPAKHYYEDEFAKVNPRFLAKAAREAHKAEVKAKAKLSKRDKLDPDKATTTLELQRRKNQAQQKPGSEVAGADDGPSTSGRAADGDAGGLAAPPGLTLQLSSGAVSRKELLERLHKKMEVRMLAHTALLHMCRVSSGLLVRSHAPLSRHHSVPCGSQEARQRRKSKEETASKAKEWKQKALQDSVAAKQRQEREGSQPGAKGKQQQQPQAGKKRPADADGDVGQQPGSQAGPQQGGKKARKGPGGPPSADSEDAEDFKFARIEVEEGEDPASSSAFRMCARCCRNPGCGNASGVPQPALSCAAGLRCGALMVSPARSRLQGGARARTPRARRRQRRCC
jgi:hypothetical protein